MFTWTKEEADTIVRVSVPHAIALPHGIDYEDTVVILKPTALTRDLMHEILRRLYKIGWVVSARKCAVDDAQWRKHYADLPRKYGADVYDAVCARMREGCVVVMRMRGEKIVSRVREIVGATNPREAQKGTIRGDLAWETAYNLVHASAVGESETELSLWQDYW